MGASGHDAPMIAYVSLSLFSLVSAHRYLTINENRYDAMLGGGDENWKALVEERCYMAGQRLNGYIGGILVRCSERVSRRSRESFQECGILSTNRWTWDVIWFESLRRRPPHLSMQRSNIFFNRSVVRMHRLWYSHFSINFRKLWCISDAGNISTNRKLWDNYAKEWVRDVISVVFFQLKQTFSNAGSRSRMGKTYGR